MQGFSSANPTRGSRTYLQDLVDIIEWPAADYLSVRMVGPIFSYAWVWFTIKTNKNPKQPIPKLCLDHDGDSDKMVSDVCPYRASGLGRIGKSYAVNVIVRDLQHDSKGRELDFPVPRGAEAEKHLGHKAYWAKKGDTRLTPVRILLIPDSQIDKLNKMRALNRAKGPDGAVQTYEMGDIRFGCDINIMEDKNKKGAAKFDIQKGDRTPLTSEERRYLIYRPDLLKPESLGAAKTEMKDLIPKIVTDEKQSRSEDQPARSGKRRQADEDNDTDIDDEIVKFDEDEDKPKSRKRFRDDEDEPRSRSSKLERSRDDDEDDEPRSSKRSRSHDEDDEDEPRQRSRSRSRNEDDEDEPRSSKRSRSRDEDDEDEPRSSKRSRDDEDEDALDLDLDADFDSEDEKPRRSSSRDERSSRRR